MDLTNLLLLLITSQGILADLVGILACWKDIKEKRRNPSRIALVSAIFLLLCGFGLWAKKNAEVTQQREVLRAELSTFSVNLETHLRKMLEDYSAAANTEQRSAALVLFTTNVVHLIDSSPSTAVTHHDTLMELTNRLQRQQQGQAPTEPQLPLESLQAKRSLPLPRPIDPQDERVGVTSRPLMPAPLPHTEPDGVRRYSLKEQAQTVGNQLKMYFDTIMKDEGKDTLFGLEGSHYLPSIKLIVSDLRKAGYDTTNLESALSAYEKSAGLPITKLKPVYEELIRLADSADNNAGPYRNYIPQ